MLVNVWRAKSICHDCSEPLIWIRRLPVLAWCTSKVTSRW
ncbi:prepilin peptidase [Pseudomonas gingeri]|uniref:Prepilin peptidase n=1 Tax=Pseudomonas gingeri TaxID=117681 RepID=A0A7Y7WRS9_9PSED|nr:prepilin peptidase [Pseudomonas gingeri]